MLVARSSEHAVQDILKKVDHIAKAEITAAEGLTTAHIHTDVPDMHSVSQKIFQAFQDAGEALLELYVQKASLEDVFLRLTEEEAVAETQKSEKKQSKKDSEAEGKEEEKS